MSNEEILEKFGVTSEQLDQWEEDVCKGSYQGEPRKVVYGRPYLCGEPMKAITITLPESMVEYIDEHSTNRSEYIRNAVAATF